MKNALFVLRYAKGTSQAETTLNSEAHSFLSEGIRQSVENFVK